MILMDGLILSSCNERLKMIDDKRGYIILSEFEFKSLEQYFPGIGIKWFTGEIVDIPPKLFSLEVTTGQNVVTLSLEKCKFIPPGPFAFMPDDSEMEKVYFEVQDENYSCDYSCGECR